VITDSKSDLKARFATVEVERERSRREVDQGAIMRSSSVDVDPTDTKKS
jgi:hypothetical protein